MPDAIQTPDYEHGCALCGNVVLAGHDLYPHFCDTCNPREGIAKLRTERDHLQKFKDYVHARLDEMGVPIDPPAEEGETEACRIGRRLRWLWLDQVSKATGGVVITDEMVERYAVAHWNAIPMHIPAAEYQKVNPEGWRGHLKFVRVGLEAALARPV